MIHAANASSLTGTSAGGAGTATLKDHGPLVKTILTQELQLYYTKITEAVLSETEDLRNAGIESIAQDPGIQGLLPYLVEFISDTVLHLFFLLLQMLTITLHIGHKEYQELACHVDHDAAHSVHPLQSRSLCRALCRIFFIL
jgi:hypothetical protein